MTTLMLKHMAIAAAILLATSAQLLAAPLQAEPVDAKWWQERHESFLNHTRTQPEKIKVLFLGDSITELWRNEGRLVWEKNFAPLSAFNYGIGGDKVQNVLWRVRNGEIDGIAPRAIVLLIGTNNVGSYSVEEISATQAELVAELRHRLPHTKILLLGVFPRVDRWSTDETRRDIGLINLELDRMADSSFVSFLNIGQKFVSPDGGVSPKIMHDGLHLTEAGYRVWAKAMQPTLRRLLERPRRGD